MLANPDAVIACGHSKTTWTKFRRALVCVFQKPKIWHNHLGAPIYLLNDLSGFIFQTEFVGLIEIQAVFRKTECFDPRDRLYGISSLLRKPEREFYYPDYSKSAVEVYRDVALHYTSLNILRACELQASPFEMTWVPDLSATHTHYMCHCLVRASPQIKAWYELSTAAAVTLRVAGVSSAVVEETKLIAYLDRGDLRTPLEYIDELLRSHDLNGYYVTGITKLEAYARTLLCDTIIETLYPNNDLCPKLNVRRRFLVIEWRLPRASFFKGFDLQSLSTTCILVRAN